jgi:LmbE family N-acetylglucosaminyl deacetylase
MPHKLFGDRVAVVGAHPDDLEMNAGGTIHRLSKEGVEVQAFTLAGYTGSGDLGLWRRQEADTAQKLLGVTKRHFLRYQDRWLADTKTEAIETLDRFLAEFQPDTVITHFHADTHQDHVAAYEICAAAARNVKNFLMFKPTFPSGRTDIPFQPTFVSQLSANDMAVKMEAMAEFKSQKRKYGEDLWLNSLRQTSAGDAWTYGGFHGYAEIFQVSRLRV